MMKRVLCVFFSLFVYPLSAFAENTAVDFATYDASRRVVVAQQGDRLRATWPIDATLGGVFEIDLRTDQPLIAGVGTTLIAPAGESEPQWILRGVDPATVVTIGTRDLSVQGWIIFFDKVNTRPYEAFAMKLDRKTARVVTEEGRTSIVIDGASAGPFAGELRYTFYLGSALVHCEAVMKTDRAATAYLFDTGFVANGSGDAPWKKIVYTNPDRHEVSVSAAVMGGPAIKVQVRNRLIGAEGANGGHLFIVPHPHQYFYPLDFCDNFASAWAGSAYRDKLTGPGFGVCQTIDGDRRYVPWVNAPPGTAQRMGVFYLLDAGDRDTATKAALAYTRNDRFQPLDGYKTFISHLHVEMAIARLRELAARKKDGQPDTHKRPEFVDVFRDMGIQIAHLAEFHLGDGDLDIASRLDRVKLLHEECARWSEDGVLLLPGEEPNVYLGGHWISLFPKPVIWTLNRGKDQPFVEEDPKYGRVYRVGNAADVLKLMETENGLMWTAHPRIKGSQGFPDAYKNSDYFKSDHFLGGAWKAMPADYSLPRLGTRVLDLLDDMNNWGGRKQALGEVDVFAIDRRSALYQHINVNYLKLDAVPKFSDGWQSIPDALRAGQFFTTTGEVLIPSFTIDGKSTGQSLPAGTTKTTLKASIEWTFPLVFAEVIAGDGDKVYRQRVSLSDTAPFGKRDLEIPVDLSGKKWVRFEVWDVAGNGAFTQPVWVGER